MPEKYDFERAWLTKFYGGLEEIAGEEIRRKVMQGSEALSSDSSRDEVIAWSQMAMERLEARVDKERQKSIMTGCACQYPRSGLQDVRKEYETTQDIDTAHRMLQERFEEFLRNTLELSDELVAEVVGRGWGLAGIRQGDTIIATKIPKSGYLVQYMQETDPEKKRQIYCHCPRVRDALKLGATISPMYCYCGAGFYKGIWEEILQEPVEVEVLESVLKGGQVCTIAIHLPHHQEI